jgi:hypothetical protein
MTSSCPLSLARNSFEALLPNLWAIIAAAVCVGLASAPHDDQKDDDRDADSYTIGLFGDMPYNALGRSQYPALLADINAHHVAFSVFDGDLKAGDDGPCADSLYTTAIDGFNTLQRPLVWLPGDNDWTDCWGRYGTSSLPCRAQRPGIERQLSLRGGRRRDEVGQRDRTPANRGAGAKGQVVLVHGDSHYFKMDKPINGPSDGVLANFTRVETFVARNSHWVSATIDPSNQNLFDFEPRLVAANTK